MARGILWPVLRVCTSHRTESLLEAFVQHLVDERKSMGPFTPTRVVVPNRNVETYLRLKLAERCGIAANLETTFLRKFLAGLAEKNVPDARVADVAHVEGHVLALLHDDTLLAKPPLERVHAYLAAAGTDRDALDRRRCQFACLLAQLFDEYAGSRPELLARWAGKAKSDAFAGDPNLESWQGELWRLVFGPDGRLAKQAAASGIRYLPLEMLWDEAMARGPTPFAAEAVHIFGMSYIATAYHHMLAGLARKSEIYVYTLNPCREDDGELRARPAFASDDPFGLGHEPNPALARWARPGRENLRLLAACPDADVTSLFPEDTSEERTLLHRLQNDIVNRRVPGRSNKPEAKYEPDGSLRVLPCPSPRRELEVVAAEIWELVRRDPSLRLCDVAVIVPEASKELYLAQLSAVFAESCDLPHSVADLPPASAHRVVEAIELLLHLPFTTFTRKEFLPLVTHPCLMARFPKATPEAWRELAHELGIVRGADRGDLEGSYVTRDLFTWDQGLRRLALGALADSTNPDDAEPFVIGGEAVLPGPPIDGAGDESLGFGLLARSLMADARFASGDGKNTPERPLDEWLDFIRGMVTSYLVLDENDGAGKTVVSRFIAGLENLSGLDNQPVSFRVAAELAERALAAEPWSRGHYLTDGVTVASFVPMRAIPFRAVFVLGLGQEAFPRPAGRDELDLRSGGRKSGDVDRREQDLYMFLETLLSARDHITFSYVARDEITGDEVPSSPVLLQLRDMLAEGYLNPAQLALLFCDKSEMRPPLRRYDDVARRREVLPAAESEHRAKQLGKSSASRAPTTESVPRAKPNPPPTGRNTSAGPLVVPLFALRRFLEDPLQGSARFRLGMFDDEDRAPADVEDELFDMDKRELSHLARTSMADALLAAQALPTLPDILAAFDRRSSRAELAGQCPTGLFRTASTRSEKDLLHMWHQELSKIMGPAGTTCRAVRLRRLASNQPAQAANRGLVYQAAPGFTLTLPYASDRPSIDVRIEGQTGLCATAPGTADTTMCFTTRLGDWKASACREDLAAFLDYVVLTAAGAETSRPGHRSAVFHIEADQGQLRVVDFGPLERDRARDYLEGLCTELVTGALDGHGLATGVHPYLLPYEAVLTSHQDRTSILDEIDRLCSGDGFRDPRFSSVQGPVASVLDRYAPPDAEQAERMVKQRFGLFFELEREKAVEDGTREKRII